MTSVTVKNTLAFLFPEKAAQPTLADMVRFLKALKSDLSMMETAYKIADEKSVFIRFKNEDAMKFALQNNEETLPFHYLNGISVMVHMSVAGGNTRYVRVFDLPPEVSELDIKTVLERYGKVKRTVREKFPAEFKLDMFTGVRGIYMEIENDIPEVLHFCNRKGRISYEGMKTKCYVCRSEAHLKKCCPILARARGGEEVLEQQSARGCDPALLEKETTAAAAADTDELNNGKQCNNKSTQHKKKAETKRQRSNDSDSVSSQDHKKNNVDNSCSSESDSSLVTVPEAPLARSPRIPSYEWIEDDNKRRLLIEEDKRRIAALYRESALEAKKINKKYNK